MRVVTLIAFAFALFATTVLAAEIAPSEGDAKPLQPGAAIPSVVIHGADGGELDLAEYVKGKHTALVVYRGGWCPYCTKHLEALKDAIEPLKALGFEIVGLSPDTPEKVSETAEKHALPYTLLSDSELSAAKALGVAFKLDTVTALKYRGYGIPLVEGALPVPSVFLVDEAGVIGFTHSETDYKQRLAAEDLIAAAKKMSTADAAKAAAE